MANLMNLMLGSGFLALQVCLSTAWSCDTTSSYQQYIALSTLNALNTTGHYTLHETGTMKFTRGSAFDNNPSSLYGVYEWPLLGNVSQPLAWLGPTDAWLWIGCTPPNLEYFSFRSYLFEQPNAQGWPDILFSSLGDSNNIMTVNTTAGGPCNRVRRVSLDCISRNVGTPMHTLADSRCDYYGRYGDSSRYFSCVGRSRVSKRGNKH